MKTYRDSEYVECAAGVGEIAFKTVPRGMVRRYFRVLVNGDTAGMICGLMLTLRDGTRLNIGSAERWNYMVAPDYLSAYTERNLDVRGGDTLSAMDFAAIGAGITSGTAIYHDYTDEEYEALP